MIIPLTPDQIRTLRDTGRVAVELSEPRQPDSRFGIDFVEVKTDAVYLSSLLNHGEEKIDLPCQVGDRVAIGEEWRYKPNEWPFVLVQYSDLTLADTPTDDQLARMPSDYDVTLWQLPDTMPEWAARYHATVATVAFKRSGDVWVWAVELEAVLAD